MIFRDVLDAAVFDSGDLRGFTRLIMLTWLNMARSEMADVVGGLWRTALNPEAAFTFDTRATGIHSLTGYEFVYPKGD